MPPSVEKRCECNRYCGFVGPFHVSHVAEIGRSRPQIVGRCYECGAYVCNRCAHRRPLGGNRALGAGELLCPLDGQPLGRGEEWIVFRGDAEAAVRSEGVPGAEVFVRVLAGVTDAGAITPAAAQAREAVLGARRLADAHELEAAERQCAAALAQDADFALARVVRQRILETARQPAAAWQECRALLELPAEILARALADAGWLAQQLGDSDGVEAMEISRLLAAGSRRGDQLPAAGARMAPAGTDTPVEAWLAEQPAPEPSGPQVTGAVARTHGLARSLLHRGHGTITAEICPSGATRTLLVLCHEADVKAQQQNVYAQLEHLRAVAAKVPVLVEGVAGAIPQARLGGLSLEDRTAKASKFIEEQKLTAVDCARRLLPLVMHGAEDASLLERQEAARSRSDAAMRTAVTGSRVVLHTSLLSCATLAAGIEERLRGANGQQLWQLRRTFEETGQMAQYLSGLAPFVEQAGLDLADYPGVHNLVRALQIERTLDFQEVERLRMGLVSQLADFTERALPASTTAALEAWCAAGSAEEQLFERLYPEILQAIGLAPPEPVQQAGFLKRLFGGKAAPPQEQAAAAPAWFARLLVLSKALADGRVSKSEYFGRLDGLLEALGARLPAPLRSYIDYVQLEGQVDIGTLYHGEIPRLDAQLRQTVAASGPEHGALRLMSELEDLNGMINLTLPSARVREVLRRAGMTALLADLDRLYAYSPPSGAEDMDLWEASRSMASSSAAVVDARLPHVREFYFHACRRSRAIAQSALDLAGDSPVRVLVCGTFHVPAIIRAVRDARYVSLLIVAPFAGQTQGGTARKRETWAHPDREDAGRPLAAS